MCLFFPYFIAIFWGEGGVYGINSDKNCNKNFFLETPVDL